MSGGEDVGGGKTTSTMDSVFRFGEVELDLHSHRLRVAGIEQPAPPRVLQLLGLLCAAPRRTFSRDELIASLWPGRRLVSDESLSQVIFKLRSALGEHAAPLVTVRGVGLRLDAEVAVASAGVPAPDATSPEPVVAAASARPRRQAWTIAAVAAAVLVAVAVAIGWTRSSSVPSRMSAWGLAPAQLHAARENTQGLILQALEADAAGDREKARLLMSVAHKADGRSPVPALLLSIWAASSGDHAAAVQQYGEATARLASIDDPVLDTYRRVADAMVRVDSTALLAGFGALLDQRPQAWIVRLMRAQLLRMRGETGAALRDLAAIRAERLDDRRMEDVLADRAALGDVAGARAALERLGAKPDEVGVAIVDARLAYSSGDLARARTDFARAAQLARGQGRSDWVGRGQLLAAGLAANAGDLDDAHTRVLDAFARAREARQTVVLLDASLMRAQLAALRGDTVERDESIAEASAQAAATGDAIWANLVELIALRLGASVARSVVGDDADLSVRGLVELLDARRAFTEGNRVLAAEKLKRATDAGVLESVAAEEADLLTCDLGGVRVLSAQIDPPPSPTLRLLTRALPCRSVESPEPARPN